jgi:hypothetical protein
MNHGWTLIGLVAIAMILCAGCATKRAVPAVQDSAAFEAPATQPLVSAPAPTTYPANAFIADPTGRVVTRVWPVSVASYPNGSTVAGAAYFETVDAAVNYPDWQVGVFQYGWFLWDLVTLPVHMVMTPPWSDVSYGGGAEQVTPIPGGDQDPVQPKLR